MIAIIGAGKMGEALLSGLLRAGRSEQDVAVVVRRPERGAELKETYGVPVLSAAESCVKSNVTATSTGPTPVGPVTWPAS